MFEEFFHYFFLRLLTSVFFFGVPCSLLLFFGISLYVFLSAIRKNRAVPGSVPESELKKMKKLLTISSVLCGLLLAVVIGFIVIISTSIAYM